MENEAYLSKETGKVYWHSECAEDLEKLPGDTEDGEKYLSIPHKNDRALGKPMALRFSAEFLAADLGTVREIFSRRGAYARFKDLLESRGVLKRWYKYEAAAQRVALVEWCAANGVDVDG
jgi:hypothetical protein